MDNNINTTIEEYSELVSGISYRMIEDSELAKEAAQEAWIEILKSLPNFKKQSKLSTYIYTIVYRTVLKYAKKEQQYSANFIKNYLEGVERVYPKESDLQEREWVKEMCNKCITASLHCLSNEDRLIILLYDVAELKSNEIANILMLSESTIRKRISRSRKKLRSFLDDQCILYNPGGSCKCQMVKNVVKVNLHKEFEKIKKDIQGCSFLRLSNASLLNEKMFLEDLCHSYGKTCTN